MGSRLSSMLVWLMCFASTSRSTLGVGDGPGSSSSNAGLGSPIPDAAEGICKSRAVIYGYECKEHTLTTKDGYILSVQRIQSGHSAPTAENKVPVLLQHGLFMDGTTWLLNSPDQSLGYILADRGYDVWISSSRGTTYSRQHSSNSARDPVYWDWSWDELAAYDLPGIVEYVHQNAQQQKIHYVGHSLGTLIALASLSQKKLVSMLRSAALLSPVAYLDHVQSPVARGAADYFTAEAYQSWGASELLPTGQTASELVPTLCQQPGVDCYNLLSSFTGNNCCLNSSSVQRLEQHGPQPTSTKNIVHMSQMILRGTITKYDYNLVISNMIHYGEAKPPAYNMSDIPKDLPLFLSYGGKDELSDTTDVERLLDRLKYHDSDKLMVQYHENYAHLDFVMAVNAKQVVYDPLMAFFKLQED